MSSIPMLMGFTSESANAGEESDHAVLPTVKRTENESTFFADFDTTVVRIMGQPRAWGV